MVGDTQRVGNFTRWAIRQSLGTKRGDVVITLIEDGLFEAVQSLARREYAQFWALLPQAVKNAIAARLPEGML